MHYLYFSSPFTVISTVLIILFAAMFSIVTVKRTRIHHWGSLVAVLFFVGLSMSVLSGFRDKMGSASALFSSGAILALLCILGGAAMLTGILMIFLRKKNVWMIGFYILSSIIIVKVILTETVRMLHYIHS